MKKLLKLSVFIFVFFGNILSAQQVLRVSDHTKVMLFAVQHQKDIANWLHKKHIRSAPPSRNVLKFLYQISDSRSTYDVHLILQRTMAVVSKLKVSRHSRARLNQKTMQLADQIKRMNNITELKTFLERKNRTIRGDKSSVSVGIQIADAILRDGIAANLYSSRTLQRFAPAAKGQTRGFWQNAYNFVNDLAKEDAMGALTGAAYTGIVTGGIGMPEGAVAGAIEASVGSVSENILENVLTSSPAY